MYFPWETKAAQSKELNFVHRFLPWSTAANLTKKISGKSFSTLKPNQESIKAGLEKYFKYLRTRIIVTMLSRAIFFLKNLNFRHYYFILGVWMPSHLEDFWKSSGSLWKIKKKKKLLLSKIQNSEMKKLKTKPHFQCLNGTISSFSKVSGFSNLGRLWTTFQGNFRVQNK